MASRSSFAILIGVLLLAGVGGARAQQSVSNWAAPSHWRASRAAGVRPQSIQSDIGNPLPFIPVTPCRIVDTRNAAGPYGGPPIAPGSPRSFALESGPCTGIPSTVAAYSLNITATNTTGTGFVKVYPQGGSSPTVSTLNFVAGETVANAAVVAAGTGGGVTVAAAAQTDVLIDINGYYVSTLNNSEQLIVSANISGDGAIKGVNASGYGVFGDSSANDGVHGHTSHTGCCVSGVAGLGDGSNYGLYGSSESGVGIMGTSFTSVGIEGHEGSGSGVAAPGHTSVFGDSDTGYGVLGASAQSDGVHGQASANSFSGVAGVHTAGGNGVFGMSVSGTGVVGHSTSGPGLHGDSSSGDGVQGQTSAGGFSGVIGTNTGSGVGVIGQSASGIGVKGTSSGSTGSGYGVFGIATVGVFGQANTSSGVGVIGYTGESFSAGTRDLSGVSGTAGNGTGVFGGSVGGDGVQGVTGGVTQSGVYGDNTGGGKGVFGASTTGNGVEGSGAGFGVFSDGTLGATGMKTFVEPHPTDPTKEIRYASLEGNEVGTYFRGTGRLVHGQATINIPEDFRMVTDSLGLTVQLTAIGSAASLYCVSRSLDGIEIAGSEDVEFDYQVNGIRKAFAGFQPIHENVVFVPHSMDARVLTVGLPAESLRRLIVNGILNEDGSINEETVRRMGWDQAPGWNERLAPASAAARPQ